MKWVMASVSRKPMHNNMSSVYEKPPINTLTQNGRTAGEANALWMAIAIVAITPKIMTGNQPAEGAKRTQKQTAAKTVMSNMSRMRKAFTG
jgi:hypothetical protein